MPLLKNPFKMSVMHIKVKRVRVGGKNQMLLKGVVKNE
jgi:hypothetical protein